eukprot:829386_1
MNSCIQVLSQTPYITRYLKKRAKIKFEYKYGKYPMLSACTQLCNIIYNKCNTGYGWNDYTICSPEKIRNALKKYDTEFAAGTQDDSSRALGYILQALDQEIDEEIMNQKTKKKENKYKDEIAIYHGRTLNEMEINDNITELLQEHNPYNSIIRKTCYGIEHIVIECLQCNKIFQQFATFRILDLAVVSQEIKLNNIIILCNDKKCCINQISVLYYCSVDILKYYAINYLVQKK